MLLKRYCFVCFLPAFFLFLPPQFVSAQQVQKPPNPLQDEIDAAVKKGVHYLKNIQNQDGSWSGKNATHKGNGATGETAICLLALLESGVPSDDPTIQKGINYIIRKPFKTTYSVGLSIMAVERLFIPEEEHSNEGNFVHGNSQSLKYKRRNISSKAKKWMILATRWLLSAMKENGGWHYKKTQNVEIKKSIKTPETGSGSGGIVLKRRKKKPDEEVIPSGRNNWDHSNTQYGVLGFAAAARCGVFVHRDHWITMLKHWLETQDKSQGDSVDLSINGVNKGAREKGNTSVEKDQGPFPKPWKYDLSSGHHKSMSPIGVASLQIIQHNLDRMGGIPEKLIEPTQKAIYDGLAYVQKNYDSYSLQQHPNPKDGHGDYYDMYSIERAMMLSRVRTLGGNNWYTQGARQLLETQNKNGNWGNSGGNGRNRNNLDIPETCFALLFLKRGTVPVNIIRTGPSH